MTSFRIDEEDGDCCDCTRKTCAQVLLTGCMGCQWRERGKKASTKCDIFWFSLLTLTFIASIVWLHYYLAANNIAFDIDCYLNGLFFNYNTWIYWYLIGLGITVILCTYLLVMMIFALLHASAHLPIYISNFHRLLLLFWIGVIGAGTAGLYLLDNNSIYLLLFMLKVTGIFIQIVVVLVMTVLTYLIAGKWLRVRSFGWQTTTMVTYIIVMLALYLCPLVIPKPLVTERMDIPQRPQLLAHRGASSIMPENTRAALDRALMMDIQGFTMDVWLSFDGVPFLFRDNNMHRTTDVERLFNDIQDINTPYWNKSQLETLNAGNWFLEANPFMKSPSLAEKTVIGQQKIPFLVDGMRSIKNSSKDILVEIHEPGLNFPNRQNYLAEIVDILNASAIDNHNIYLLDDILSGRISPSYNFSRLSRGVATEELLTVGNYSGIYIQSGQTSTDMVRSLQQSGKMIVVNSVNCQWLYSLMWMIGVDKVVTKFPQDLRRLTAPIYTIEPTSYLIIWTTVDGVSILAVLLLWGLQIHERRKSAARELELGEPRQPNAKQNVYMLDHRIGYHANHRRHDNNPPSNLHFFRQPSLTRVDIILRTRSENWGMNMPSISEWIENGVDVDDGHGDSCNVYETI